MPFIRFSYVNEIGTSRSAKSSDNLIHFNAVRMRVSGNGFLKQKLFSSDDIRQQQLKDISMSDAPGRNVTSLANFIEQYASLEVKTTLINDFFKINRIIIFTKEWGTSYPQ